MPDYRKFDNEKGSSSVNDDDDDDEKKNTAKEAAECDPGAFVLLSVFGVLAAVFGFCPCFKWKHRLVLMWFWLLGISLTIGLLLNLHFYGPVTSPTDNKSPVGVTEQFNSAICSKLVVTSDKPVDVYLNDSLPTVAANSTSDKLTMYTKRLGRPPDYQSIGFYLIKGSFLSIHIDYIEYSNTNPRVYLEKGRGGATDGGKVVKQDLPMFIGFLFDYNVTESDYYYIVFVTEDLPGWSPGFSTPMELTITTDRKVYDLPYPPSVENTTKAEFDLDYGAPYALVFKYNGTSAKGDIANVVSSCTPRLSIYIPCLFVVPLLIGLTITAVVYRKYGNEYRQS